MNKLKTIASAVAIAIGVTLAPSVLSVPPAEANHTRIKVFIGGSWIWRRHNHRHCGYVWKSHRHYKGGRWHKHRVRTCW